MNKNAKTISRSLRPEIERVKSYIRDSNGRGFDGDGYAFKTAIRELRESGMTIIRDKEKCCYFVK